MKKIVSIGALCLLCISSFNRVYAQHKLVMKWETDSVLKSPESVCYDAGNQILYVSNINGKADSIDGNGSIAKVGLDGKVIDAEWAKGLNGPKGLALVKNILWAADINEVVGVDIKTGKIIKHIKIDGAKFLNDLAADPQGNLYVSDSQKKTVHKIENGKVTTVLENLQGPNGVLIYNNELYVLDNGGLYKAGKDKSLQKLADGLEGHTDGVENVEGNDFIVSGWMGVVYYVKADGSSEKLLDTRDQQKNAADIGYDAKNRVVYVPTFFRNSVVAYQLQ